jgi:DNA-binding NarL/FixJ family response regulator
MSSLDRVHDLLLAEDDKDDVEIFEMALRQAEVPHILRHAEDGKRLFVLLKEKTPYILFLDIRMPCEDGISCIIAIRKNRDYDQLPVIMYSSSSYPKYVEDAYRNGANYFMVKPHDLESIVANLRRIFAINWDEYQHFPVRDEFLIK